MGARLTSALELGLVQSDTVCQLKSELSQISLLPWLV